MEKRTPTSAAVAAANGIDTPRANFILQSAPRAMTSRQKVDCKVWLSWDGTRDAAVKSDRHKINALSTAAQMSVEHP